MTYLVVQISHYTIINHNNSQSMDRWIIYQNLESLHSVTLPTLYLSFNSFRSVEFG